MRHTCGKQQLVCRDCVLLLLAHFYRRIARYWRQCLFCVPACRYIKSLFGGRSGDRFALGDADGEELTHLGRSLAEGGFEVCQPTCRSMLSWLIMVLLASSMRSHDY